MIARMFMAIVIVGVYACAVAVARGTVTVAAALTVGTPADAVAVATGTETVAAAVTVGT